MIIVTIFIVFVVSIAVVVVVKITTIHFFFNPKRS